MGLTQLQILEVYKQTTIQTNILRFIWNDHESKIAEIIWKQKMHSEKSM